MRSYFLSLTIILSFIFCDCNTQKKDLKEKDSTVTQEIPKLKNGKVLPYYLLVKEFEKGLKIDSLNEGFDSLQIRLWHYTAMQKEGELAVFKNNKHQWTAFFYNLNYEFDTSIYVPASISKIFFKKEPKSGWEAFTKRLYDFKILTLPDCNNIINYCTVSDGDCYMVEIANKHSYRFYTYSNPGGCKGISQVDNFFNILDLINSEFQFRMPPY